MSPQLLKCLDALTNHRRRAATVAALLVHCDRNDMEDGLLAEAGDLIVHELQGIRQCTEILQKEIGR